MSHTDSPVGLPSVTLLPLVTAEAIGVRIRELGAQISADYRGLDLLLVGVLKGAFMFLADLMRSMDTGAEVDFLGCSSYGDATTTSGVVKITHDLSTPVQGRHVLLVEDIVDTGLTARYLIDNLRTRGPASLKLCTLLHKPSGARTAVPIDYVGFTIPARFVIGYGLDLRGKFRGLPYVGFVKADGDGEKGSDHV